MLLCCNNLQNAENLWRNYIPPETVFDLWEVRLAFHRQFQRPFRFFHSSDCSTFLPISWVEERQAWCCFPGETWHNKTWLEQNRFLPGELSLEELTEIAGGELHLRYLNPEGIAATLPVDETGYLFIPARYEYRMENWWNSFLGRRRKQLRLELDSFHGMRSEIRGGVDIRYDWLVETSIKRFGKDSYFSDPRFREGFRSMLEFLAERGFLRVTTILQGNTVAAVDFGSVYKQRYTLLAGATAADFPGVAKLINLQHLQWVCEQRMKEADFLCGDFSWKPLFHLSPRPLHLFSSAEYKQKVIRS